MCDRANEVAYVEYEQTAGQSTGDASFRINHHCPKCLTVYIIVFSVEDELIDDRRTTICLHILSLLIQRHRDYNSNDLLNSHNKANVAASLYCSFAAPSYVNILNISSVHFLTIILRPNKESLKLVE